MKKLYSFTRKPTHKTQSCINMLAVFHTYSNSLEKGNGRKKKIPFPTQVPNLKPRNLKTAHETEEVQNSVFAEVLSSLYEGVRQRKRLKQCLCWSLQATCVCQWLCATVWEHVRRRRSWGKCSSKRRNFQRNCNEPAPECSDMRVYTGPGRTEKTAWGDGDGYPEGMWSELCHMSWHWCYSKLAPKCPQSSNLLAVM